ncbi:methylated-DNA--[protein]-cysteine S-methyltransferase [Kitasatospora atroaurantiaca]|uniref:Methylated-DNA--protein-cysteine methyltransferase n=1 Tax=Kitasatospora atroaurantiaca TaxID=285545 RepID=A0A561EI93_9ACTN|nr:methylated-DNA--[protein]-cysteine S-methyltransferase [Kitasatospora atroaurantiaca]TWE15331.1 methylated-DNA-[protein]-cysteine S-methyltransferase [Kitasatospora atroaurantiaca]
MNEEHPTTLYRTIDSPLGTLMLVGEESASAKGGVALASVSMTGQKNAAVVQEEWRHEPEAFTEVVRQIRAYFAGDLQTFDLDYTTHGTEFQERVWRALDAIPYGTTTTYGGLAEQIGAPRAAVRALGGAIGANPLLLVRPCHRVIGADGSLTGYAGGVDRKEHLLRHESDTHPA